MKKEAIEAGHYFNDPDDYTRLEPVLSCVDVGAAQRATYTNNNPQPGGETHKGSTRKLLVTDGNRKQRLCADDAQAQVSLYKLKDFTSLRA